jgi:sugar phosphate isomerase/epimerase
VKHPLSFCTLDYSPLFGLPERVREQATAAGRAGFEYLTPDMFTLRAYVESGGSMVALADHFAASGIRAHDIAGTNISADSDASRREITELAGYARALGAPWVQSRVTAALDDDATLDTYRECAAIAASNGVALALEFSPFTPVDSLARARDVLDEVRAAAPNQGIVVDTWHLAHTDGFAALRDLPASDLAFVQLDDAEAGSGDRNADTMHRRAMPGEGMLDLATFVDALRVTGFDGVVTVEVLSAELRMLPIDAYAARAYTSSVSVLARPL